MEWVTSHLNAEFFQRRAKQLAKTLGHGIMRYAILEILSPTVARKFKLRGKEPDPSTVSLAMLLYFATMTRYHHILISLFISPYIIHGVPTTAPLSLPTDDTLPPYSCNDSPAWSGPAFDPRDCAAAMSQFFAYKLLVHEDTAFEFLAVGGQPRAGYPLQSTPLKFTYGEPVHLHSHLNSCPKASDVHLQNK